MSDGLTLLSWARKCEHWNVFQRPRATSVTQPPGGMSAGQIRQGVSTFCHLEDFLLKDPHCCLHKVFCVVPLGWQLLPIVQYPTVSTTEPSVEVGREFLVPVIRAKYVIEQCLVLSRWCQIREMYPK